MGAARVAAANARKLGVERLGRVISHLVAAEKSPEDPLHAWARLCRLPGQPSEDDVSAVLDPLRKSWARCSRGRSIQDCEVLAWVVFRTRRAQNQQFQVPI